jgi:murein DD-endopeptidase MepM/ murein hydrolase activator NlpD
MLKDIPAIERIEMPKEKPKYCYPCLPWSDYSVQPGTAFLDLGYERATGDLHSGVDMNARTGGDTDKGHSVYCIADGVVVYAGFDNWVGGIVIVYHAGADVWSCYWHLEKILVNKGQTLLAGEQIGAIGKGGHQQFSAHLHFEIRLAPPATLHPNEWASANYRTRYANGRVKYDREGALEFIKEHYVDPMAFLKKNKAQTQKPLT